MAFLQSAPPRQPFFRSPPIVLWLIAGLGAAHAARIWMSPLRQAAILNEYAFIPARYSHTFLAAHDVDPGSLGERALPFVTYMGLHNDWTHIAGNCLWLFAFGPIVARRFGTMLFLVFFLLCGVAGAATYLAFNWGSSEPMIGASGAIAGLMAAGIRMLPGQAPWALPGTAPLAPLFSRSVLAFSAVWMAVNLVIGVTGLGIGGQTVLIAWQAHLGGYVAGLLLAGAFDAIRPREPARPQDLQ